MAVQAIESGQDTTRTAAEINTTVSGAAVDTSLTDDDAKAFEAAVAADSGKAQASPSEPKPPAPAPNAPKEPPKTPASTAIAALTDDDIPEAAIDPKAIAAKAAAEADPAVAQAQRKKEIIEATKNMSTKAADSFRTIEKKAWEAEQRAARLPELESKLAEKIAELDKIAKLAKEKPEPDELERYKKRVEELDAIVWKNEITEHPKFKAKFDEQIEKEITRAKSFAGETNAEEISELLQLAPSKRRDARLNELISEAEPLYLGKLGSAIDKVDRLREDRTTELTNWKDNIKAMKIVASEESMKSVAARRAALESAYSNTMSNLSDPEKGIELYRPVDGNDDWNKKVSTRAEAVKNILSTDLTPDQLAEMAAMAIASKDYRTLFHAQRTALKKLQAQIADMKGAEPNLGGGGESNSATEDNASMVDAVVSGLVRSGALK